MKKITIPVNLSLDSHDDNVDFIILIHETLNLIIYRSRQETVFFLSNSDVRIHLYPPILIVYFQRK